MSSWLRAPRLLEPLLQPLNHQLQLHQLPLHHQLQLHQLPLNHQLQLHRLPQLYLRLRLVPRLLRLRPSLTSSLPSSPVSTPAQHYRNFNPIYDAGLLTTIQHHPPPSKLHANHPSNTPALSISTARLLPHLLPLLRLPTRLPLLHRVPAATTISLPILPYSLNANHASLLPTKPAPSLLPQLLRQSLCLPSTPMP